MSFKQRQRLREIQKDCRGMDGIRGCAWLLHSALAWCGGAAHLGGYAPNAGVGDALNTISFAVAGSGGKNVGKAARNNAGQTTGGELLPRVDVASVAEELGIKVAGAGGAGGVGGAGGAGGAGKKKGLRAKEASKVGVLFCAYIYI
jgi:hypothetical protein